MTAAFRIHQQTGRVTQISPKEIHMNEVEL